MSTMISSSFLFVLSTLLVSTLSITTTTSSPSTTSSSTSAIGTTSTDKYIYISADANCITLNYTCDGSLELPFSRIQDGLDVADGETVIILEDGTYSGEGNINLTIYDKYSRIKSLNGYLNTIIDCENNGFGIAYNKGTFLLTGITIQNCNGIVRELYNLSLGNGTAVPSNPVSKIGGALWIENGYAKIKDCLLDSNTAEYGGGLYVYSVTVDIENTIISNNYASKLGGGIYLWNGYVYLNHSTGVINNNADNGGGGLYISKGTVELDYYSYLYANEAANNLGNEVFCASGAGTLLNSAYISALSIDASDFQYGDAICYDDCALTQSASNFDYCNYVPPTTTTGDGSDSDGSDSDGSDSGTSDSGTSGELSAGNHLEINGRLSILLNLCVSLLIGRFFVM